MLYPPLGRPQPCQGCTGDPLIKRQMLSGRPLAWHTRGRRGTGLAKVSHRLGPGPPGQNPNVTLRFWHGFQVTKNGAGTGFECCF